VTATEEREGKRPPRQVYALTPAGEEVFQKLLRQRLATHVPTDHADAVSLNFLSLLPAAEAVALLSRRLDVVQQRLDELQEQAVEDAETHYGVDYLLHHVQVDRDWLRKLIDKLAAQIQESGTDPKRDEDT
jgi:DNA-binding PadR family transcriptional regulator